MSNPDAATTVTTALRCATRPPVGTLTALHTRLERHAADADLLDIAYRVHDTPIGPLLLAATPIGLVRVGFACEGHDAVLTALAARLSPRVLHAPARLDDAAQQMDEYFQRRRTSFQLPLDLSLSHGFRVQVLRQLSQIRYGCTQSYTQVAQAVGHPKAVRAVGSACATNPLPVVVPCHRVVRSDGSLGGYLATLAVKRTLLDLEAKSS